MVFQLFIGTLAMLVTILTAAAFSWAVLHMLVLRGQWVIKPPHARKFVIVLLALVLWIQLAVTLAVWTWALMFYCLGVLTTLEESVYFAVVSFTTLGFGDILLPKQWRLLSGMAASNGLLYFGFFTAFLVEVMRRVRQDQLDNRPEPN